MKGRTNSGAGGGGGISPKNALLVVYTPLGSSVIATNGTATKTSNTGITLSDRPTVEIHLFSISSSQYGTWTVTATRDTDSNVTTVIIDAPNEYDLSIGYHVPINLYQEVEYLYFPSGAYINTGVSANAETDGIFAEEKVSETSYLNDRHYFGADQSYGSTYHLTSYNNRYYWGGDNTEKNGGSWTVGEKVLEHNDKSRNYGVYVNGTRIGDGKAFQPDQSIFIGRRGSAINFAGNVYYFHLKGNTSGNYLRKMFPCYRLSDSVAGMYDNINGVFYTNAGSGTFIVGADVS